MLPFEKILCPTDFSEPSYEAIRAAGELAHHFAAELCVVHVVSPVPSVPIGNEPSAFNVPLYERELESSAKRSIEEIINQMEWRDLKVRLVVLRGNAADEIVRVAEEENADLIVIATRGRSGLDRLLFGSVAEKVVRLAKCPVLTIVSRPSAEAEKEATEEKEEVKRQEKSEKRNAYLEKVEAELGEWGLQVDVLKAKAEKSKAEVKMKYLEQVQELKKKQEVAIEKLNELRESGDEAWGDFRKGVEEALGEMKKALKQAASRFKKR